MSGCLDLFSSRCKCDDSRDRWWLAKSVIIRNPGTIGSHAQKQKRPARLSSFQKMQVQGDSFV